MVLKRLPLEVQSIFCASTQIKTFETAVEELVYNAFDANSTSIAIRVNIQENYIQLVDNGHGVSKEYFHLLGQRYTTSKYDESVASKLDQKYGRSGQSLANIIQISQSVKITSRCKSSEDTWLKHFYNGKEKECILASSRPSAGTTVEIEGFLYNQKIQKKTIKALQELQRIKTFLKQMSLVHYNTSISLRDNSENEIIFKIHKNRDIYQTLSLLSGIEKSNLQELQVEKNQYKVTGFIQKQETDTRGFQWIFINRRFMNNSNLHEMISHNLVKSLPQKITKTKSHINDKDRTTMNNKVPDYFIFIECPLNDYDIISNPKQSILEFKNCNLISKLLEKLTKFYNGEISLKNKMIAKNYVKEDKSKTNDTNTRIEVKMIMEKILGSHHNKKINESQLHNGVKGKNIKRKRKKKLENYPECNMNPKDKKNIIAPSEKHKFSDLREQNEQPLKKVKDSDIKANDCAFKVSKRNEIKNTTSKNNRMPKIHKELTRKNKNRIDVKDPVLSKFEKETSEVQKRCKILAKKVDNLLCFKRKRKRKIFTNEYFQYSTVVKDSKKMTIRKKIDEVIIHEYLPLPPQLKAINRDCNVVMKSYDLLRPVTIFHQNDVEYNEFHTNTVKQQTDVYEKPSKSPYDTNIPRLTYESHCYVKDTEVRHMKQKVFEKNKVNERKFITDVSQNHFLSPKKLRKEIFEHDLPIPAKKHKMAKKSSFMKTGNDKQVDELQPSYSIQFTKTDSQPHETPNIAPIVSDFTAVDDKSPIGSTYSIIDADKRKINDDVSPRMIIQKAVDVCDFKDTYSSEAFRDIDYGFDQTLNYNNALVKDATPNDDETYSGKATYLKKYYADKPSKLDGSLNVDGTPEIYETYCIEARLSHAHKHYTDQSPKMHEFQDSVNRNANASYLGSSKFNILFISNSQQSDNGMILDPVHICETVLDQQDAYANDEYNFIFNSVNDINITNEQHIGKTTELCEIELHSKNKNPGSNIFIGNKQDVNEEFNPGDNATDFNLKNRRRYIPKGMSQIFENCNTRGVCNYETDKDYFEDTVYNNFVDDVHINSEIFGPRIQNVKELATRDIERVNNKLSKDNACLTFNGESLKRIKVLGQVDYKFIATKIQDKAKEPHGYLVLFDQHAVDERIRLEKNMADYFDGDQWQSVKLDSISLKFNKDEILYLHNYKKKFHKLGLEWTILDNSEVSVTAIPAAILGKNPRQVETVLKAVKSLIKEEINMIKEQGGCVSLYPKSIMDLVFSEACRYAIMFGDALSKMDCVSLLNELSECKTPFQCAHGRPVMAVLMDIRTEKHEYKINLKSVQQFRRRIQNSNK